MDYTFLFYIFFAVMIVLLLIVTKQFHKNNQKIKPVKKEPIMSLEPAKGVGVDILKNGQGIQAKAGHNVKVHYTAWLPNGKKVDSSYDKGELFAFTLGKRQVIPGWEDGMIGMRVGEIRKFTIAPEKAYGAKGKANVPPNSPIIFEVELIKLY